MTAVYENHGLSKELDLSIKNTFVHAALAMPALARTQSCPGPEPLARTTSVGLPQPIREESVLSCDASGAPASPRAESSGSDSPRVPGTPEPEPGLLLQDGTNS